MAKALAANGAKVAIGYNSNSEKADGIVAEIEQNGGTALAVQTNVLDKEQLQEAEKAVKNAFGPVSLLVNGAGGNKKEATTGPDLSFFDIPADAFQWVFNLNLVGPLLTTQVFAKSMTETGRGNIINISSMNAFTPLTKIAAYSSAKAAVNNFTQWLAVHMSQNYSPDIRVNAIAPGFFLTEQNRFLLTKEDGSTTPRGQQIIDHTPAERYGKAEELVSTLLWLCAPESSFVHGVVVPVDGGFSAYSGV
jgi:NAD(P)-dependent dehydrogenase (short-subunit alcohol dehydrogenase family)